MTDRSSVPLFALTQGDPAGVGPQILARCLTRWRAAVGWRPLLIAERCAVESLPAELRAELGDRLVELDRSALAPEHRTQTLAELGSEQIPMLDPTSSARSVVPGHPTDDDARGALAAVDLGVEMARSGIADALVTAPVAKASIARVVLPTFRGHTDHIALRFGLSRYGADYLMGFLSSDLRVALLSMHLPLREAIALVDRQRVATALIALDRHLAALGMTEPRIALAGLNPHAGEDGLLGSEETEILDPAVKDARDAGVAVEGPISPDTVFHRAREGEFDWVLALYHDQGLIAVKTIAFGGATNITLGLPILRTSVDHGTAYPVAERGTADDRPMQNVLDTTAAIVDAARGRRSARG